MRLGYKHEKDKIESNRYWNNTILPLLKNGSLEHAVEGTYAYPNRIGLYPGMTCQFFCTFCGRNYNAKYNSTDIAKSFEVFKQVIDQDPKEGEFWQDRFRISGGLEPLTNPHIGKIISYGNSQGFKMQMYTNGYALTKNFLQKQQGILDLEVMRISLYGKIKLGVNWIILPGHSEDVRSVFEMIKDINGVSDFKISFITLREDFSQSNNYISNEEREKLHKIFLEVEKDTDVHIDYGYALHSVRHGKPTGPLKMATHEQMDKHGWPQIATSIDSLGNLYVYHETGFLERPGSERYIIGNIKDSSVTEIVKKHLQGPGIKAQPFDVSFLDAFDHTTTLLLYEAKQMKKTNYDWKKVLENKWKSHTQI
jgi:dTDP-4-amino-4,6-dideoxy-D-glucose ammonia-lyase